MEHNSQARLGQAARGDPLCVRALPLARPLPRAARAGMRGGPATAHVAGVAAGAERVVVDLAPDRVHKGAEARPSLFSG